MISSWYDAVVLSIGAVDRIEHDRAVFDAPADRTELVHRPRKRHRARPRHSAECRPESRCSTARRGRGDRSESLASNREADESRGSRRCGSGGRATRALIHLPGIFCSRTKPDVTLRQLAERQLRDEHCSRSIESLHHRGICIDHLLLERARAPGRLISANGEEVFCSPRNSVQRSAIFSRPNLTVRCVGLPQRSIFGETDHAPEHRVVLLQASEIHLRELNRRHPLPTHELRELRQRKKRELVLGRHGSVSDFTSYHRTASLRHDLLSRRKRIEYDGGTDRVRKHDLVESFDSLLLLLQAIEHQLPLGGIESDAGDFLRAGNRLDRDVGAGGDLRPEHAGEKCRGQADAREVAHELTAIDYGCHCLKAPGLRWCLQQNRREVSVA